MSRDKLELHIPKLKFPTREFLQILIPVSLIIILIGYYAAVFLNEAQIKSLIEKDTANLNHFSGLLAVQISTTLNHLQAIKNEQVTRNAANTESSDALHQLSQSLLMLSKRNPVYHQVRWIDENGMEKIRISQEEQAPVIIREEQLQDKSGRYYFQKAINLPTDHLYLSRIDLNEEHGEIGLPLSPTVRIATPIENKAGDKRGLLIININMNSIFNRTHYFENIDKSVEYILLNQDGMFINVNPRYINTNTNDSVQLNFANKYPETWVNIKKQKLGTQEIDYGFWAWQKVTSLDNILRLQPALKASDKSNVISDDFSYFFVTHRAIDFLLDMRQSIRISVFGTVLLTILVFALLLFLFLKNRFREIRSEFEVKCAMNHANQMTQLKELEERYRLLFEANSIGQLVVNSKGNIESSNTMAENLLGYSKAELMGINIDKLLPKGKQTVHQQYREEYIKSPQTRRMGMGKTLRARKNDGTEIPVEIGLTPYTEKEQNYVLVNIVDLPTKFNI